MIVYKATYKCRYCERKFDSEYHYCGLDDAVHHFDSCMKFQPVHFCKGGHPQMRELMCPLLKELQSKIPVVFDDIYTYWPEDDQTGKGSMVK